MRGPEAVLGGLQDAFGDLHGRRHVADLCARIQLGPHRIDEIEHLERFVGLFERLDRASAFLHPGRRQIEQLRDLLTEQRCARGIP